MIEYGIAGESIVCFAGEDWWYHHPHSKNHLLKRFARQNKVLFINSLSMGLPAVNNPDFLLKIRRKLKSYARWLRKVPEGMWVLTPLSLPCYGSRVGRLINRILVTVQVRFVMLLCGMHNPIVWVAIPSAAEMVDSLDPKLVLYQVSDKYDSNRDSALSVDIIRQFDSSLKRRAALVLYSGRRLFEEATEPNRYFLEQAVDFEHFSRRVASIAPEIASIPHPVLAYVGWMDFVMDNDLIEEVARRQPDWNWVFIGTKTNHVRASAPNIHFLGPKPYSDLPSYMSHVDVFVLPWNQDCAFTSYGSAIKVKEYLATGKPVVISPLYEYLAAPGIRIYRSVDEFIANVKDALRETDERLAAERQSAVRNCTWDVRAEQLGNIINALIHGREYATATCDEPAKGLSGAA